MKTISQTQFAEPEDIGSIREQALVVHRKEATKNNQLIIFVHGLGGCRYGRKATWGKFPSFIFEDFPHVDVGLYEYRTLFRRLKVWKSVGLDTEAEVFANLIRDELAVYTSIVLVGHSMGGLLCKAAISRLVSNKEEDVLPRISGLILMATPQLGSRRVPKLLALLSSDFRVLEAHSRFISEIHNIFDNHVNCTEHDGGVARVTIPTWAVVGASDFWVDRTSSGIGLASSRKKVARGSHTEIVKPKTKDDGIYSWVRDRIKMSLERFKYDVFIASAMAGLQTEQQYQESRKGVLEVQQLLKDGCHFQSIYYAGQNLTSKAEFDAQDVALEDDIRALSASRYFLLLYPEKIASSVIFEAGVALACGKPSVYLVRERKDLPYLMSKAEQASSTAKVKIYDYDTHGDLAKLIKRHGVRLWFRKA
jgi:pimeloyl-ACP methyl ester carboxylesterase